MNTQLNKHFCVEYKPYFNCCTNVIIGDRSWIEDPLPSVSLQTTEAATLKKPSHRNRCTMSDLQQGSTEKVLDLTPKYWTKFKNEGQKRSPVTSLQVRLKYTS